jgi:hypothetical protein
MPPTRTNPRLASPMRSPKKSPGMAFGGKSDPRLNDLKERERKATPEETKRAEDDFEIIEVTPTPTLQRNMSERNVLSPKKPSLMSVIPNEEVQRAASTQDGGKIRSPRNHQSVFSKERALDPKPSPVVKKLVEKQKSMLKVAAQAVSSSDSKVQPQE